MLLQCVAAGLCTTFNSTCSLSTAGLQLLPCLSMATPSVKACLQCLPPTAVQDVVRRTQDRLEGIVSQTAPDQEPAQQQPGRLPPLTAEAVAAQHKALARLTADMQRQLDQLSKAVEGLQRVRGPLACC